MPKFIYYSFLVAFLYIIINILNEYLFNYINFIFYHVSLTIALFFWKLLAPITLQYITSWFIWFLIISTVFFFINLIRE